MCRSGLRNTKTVEKAESKMNAKSGDDDVL